jgi:AcrR family transcriptional regulator
VTRTKPAEQRRAELLAAGQALFLAKGIAATSLDDITQRAGVSKGLFYLYFHAKEDLVLALQEQFSRQVAARMRAAADAQADWTAKLDACVQASFECHRDLHDLHEVLFHHAPPAGRAGRPGHDDHAGRDDQAGRPSHGDRAGHDGRAGHGDRAGHDGRAGHGDRAGHDERAGHDDRAGHGTRPESGPAHAAATRVIQDLFAAGTAAGAFDVADPEAAALLCYASMHAFDQGFRGYGGPADARLIQAARDLFRRAAGAA